MISVFSQYLIAQVSLIISAFFLGFSILIIYKKSEQQPGTYTQDTNYRNNNRRMFLTLTGNFITVPAFKRCLAGGRKDKLQITKLNKLE